MLVSFKVWEKFTKETLWWTTWIKNEREVFTVYYIYTVSLLTLNYHHIFFRDHNHISSYYISMDETQNKSYWHTWSCWFYCWSRKSFEGFGWGCHNIGFISWSGYIIDYHYFKKLYISFFNQSGVEAQTLTVWRQADRYEVPRIIYLNKMDKVGANFSNCLKQIERKLKCVPLPCHLPLGGEGKEFHGIIDLVDLTIKKWELGKK